MLNCVVRVVYLIAVWAVISSPLASTVFAQTDATSEQNIRATQEIEACSRNLRQIYDAIRAYQRDHNDIPNWLSDLVPRYINDPSVLECPVCRRTGKKESPDLSDPKLPTCYLYEFAPGPINSRVPGVSAHTRREWKLRQMALVGTMIPIVRCRQHAGAGALNLAYDGRIYQSPGLWESLLTNHINLADLSAEGIFGSASTSSPMPSTAAGSIPRDPSAKPGMIDLTDYYNAILTDAWHGPAGNDLAALPSGLQYLAGVDWDIRGIVQLVGKGSTKKYPKQVTGIKISLKCQRLNFLHSACFGGPRDEGSEVGAFVVHYATNRLQMDIPILYGTDVRDWHAWLDEPVAPKELVEAWTGQNAVSQADRRYIRLFKTTWTNPFPEYQIENLDYVSRVTNAAPFLIAITAE